MYVMESNKFIKCCYFKCTRVSVHVLLIRVSVTARLHESTIHSKNKNIQCWVRREQSYKTRKLEHRIEHAINRAQMD